MSDSADVKPRLEDLSQDLKPKITITVNFEGRTTNFSFKKTTVFSKVFATAEKQFGVGPQTLRFTFDGDRVRPEQTPTEVGLEDGDEIQAHVEQIGG